MKTLKTYTKWSLMFGTLLGLHHSAFSGTQQSWRDRNQSSQASVSHERDTSSIQDNQWQSRRDRRQDSRQQRPTRPRPPRPQPDDGQNPEPRPDRPNHDDNDHSGGTGPDRFNVCRTERTVDLFIDWRGPFGPFTKQRWYYHDVGLNLHTGHEYAGRALLRPAPGTVPLYQCQVMFLGNNDRMIILDEREFASCRGPRELLGFIPAQANPRNTVTMQRWFDRRDHYVCPKNEPCKAHRLGVKSLEYEFNLCR